jgi:SAM-dependent methyltransferase
MLRLLKERGLSCSAITESNVGIAKPAVEVLIQEAARSPFHGSIVTLGRQDVFVSGAVLSELANQSGVQLSNPTVHPAQKTKLAEKGCISDDTLFLSLGFSEYRSMDVSTYESADIQFDLNQSALPPELENRFDVVLDGGTMEHVFHVPNALQNIFRLLKVGGRVIHLSPSSNHIDHGFYMFSPTLFWDFYSANQFEINRLALSRYTPQHNTGPYQMTPYTPGSLRSVSFGGLDNAMYGVVVVATKTSLSSGDRVPQQGAYIDQWKVKSVSEPAQSSQKVEEYVSAVFAALKQRDFSEAEILSGRFVTQFESHPQSWLIRGIVLRLVNQTGPAYEALQKSLRLHVTRDALTQLMHVCEATGRFEEMAALGKQLAAIGGAL